MMTPITATNDFVVKFANVNGSGSASANEMFARAIIRMGVPVAPRNILVLMCSLPAPVFRSAGFGRSSRVAAPRRWAPFCKHP